jgi:hypothetical protein
MVYNFQPFVYWISLKLQNCKSRKALVNHIFCQFSGFFL